MEFSITTNWSFEEDSDISSSISFINEIERKNFLELLDEDKCFSLKKEAESLDAFPYLNIVGDEFLKHIVLLSESKNIEVYIDSCKEYFGSFHGILLSEFNDSKMYKTMISFRKPTRIVSLHLKGICNIESVWVYGVFFELVGGPFSKEPASMFNRASKVLEEKDIKISENAERFKKFWKDYSNQTCLNSDDNAQTMKQLYRNISENLNSPITDPSSVNKFLGSQLPIPLPNQSELPTSLKDSKNLEDMIQRMQMFDGFMLPKSASQLAKACKEQLNNVESGGPVIQNSCPNCVKNSMLIEKIETAIENKIKAAEERIVSKLEEKFLKANEDVLSRLEKFENVLLYLTDKHG